MKPIAHPLRPLLAVLAFVGGIFTSAQALPNHSDQIPLILRAERLPTQREGWVSELVVYNSFMRSQETNRTEAEKEIEPFGLHVPNTIVVFPVIDPRALENKEGKVKLDFGPDKGALRYTAYALASISNKNVLVSARVEHRQIDGYRLSGSAHFATKQLIKILGEADVEVRLLDDTYVLFEAPGKEREFDYRLRPRAAVYEEEREIWLEKHPRQHAQGLIYQPTLRWDLALASLKKEKLQVRHAATMLSKLTQKEVFVVASVEKQKFEYPRSPELQPHKFQEQVIKQLDRIYVRVVDLGPNALALAPR